MYKILRNSCSALAITALLVFFNSYAAARDVQPASGSITYQTFYDELSPYGTWIDYPGYGHV